MMLGLAAALGCESDGPLAETFQFKGAKATGEPPAPGEWPFRPVAMRIHPFTALTINETQRSTVLEARIELLDQLGDVAKGVGELRFELYEMEPTASRTGQEKQVQRWDAPLATLDQNRQHWDAITRTYTFRLRLVDTPRSDKKYRLVAQLTDPNGNRLRAESPVAISRTEDAAN